MPNRDNSEIRSPPVPEGHPDRHVHCQFVLCREFMKVASGAIAAGWNEREVAAALVDLADNHMLGLISNGEMQDILKAIKKS